MYFHSVYLCIHVCVLLMHVHMHTWKCQRSQSSYLETFSVNLGPLLSEGSSMSFCLFFPQILVVIICCPAALHAGISVGMEWSNTVQCIWQGWGVGTHTAERPAGLGHLPLPVMLFASVAPTFGGGYLDVAGEKMQPGKVLWYCERFGNLPAALFPLWLYTL